MKVLTNSLYFLQVKIKIIFSIQEIKRIVEGSQLENF